MSCPNNFLIDKCNVPLVTGGDPTQIDSIESDKIDNIIKIIDSAKSLSKSEAVDLHKKLLCDDDCDAPDTGNVLFDTLNNYNPSNPMSETELIEHLGGKSGLTLEQYSKIMGLIVIDKTRKVNMVYNANQVLNYNVSKEGLSSSLQKNTAILHQLSPGEDDNMSVTTYGDPPYTVIDKFGDDYRLLSTSGQLDKICPHIYKYNELIMSFLVKKSYEKVKVPRTYKPIIREKLVDYLSERLKKIKTMSALQGLLRRREFYADFVSIVVETLLREENTEILMTLEYEKEHISYAYSNAIKKGVSVHRNRLLNLFERSTNPHIQLVKIFEDILDHHMELILSQKILKPVLEKSALQI